MDTIALQELDLKNEWLGRMNRYLNDRKAISEAEQQGEQRG